MQWVRFFSAGVGVATIALCVISFSNLSGCKSESNPLDTLQLKASPEAGGVVPHPAGLPFTAEEIKLGQILFFSPELSNNGKVSCATCHDPSLSYTDLVAKGTSGVTGVRLDRNAPPIINLAWADSLFWDGRSFSLEHQAFGPLTHPNEMGMDTAKLPARVAEKLPAALTLIERIYGNKQVTNQRLVRAIAMYERSLVSMNATYDRYRRRDRGYRLMPDAMANGFQLFNVNCGSCHSGDNFTDNRYHNIGLEPWPEIRKNEASLGRFRITGARKDIGAFRTPGLRNIALTAPYMHDGRFKTLADVVRFYSQQVVNVPNLDSRMRDGNGQPGLKLTAQEQADLVTFLESLTDTVFVNQHKNDHLVVKQ